MVEKDEDDAKQKSLRKGSKTHVPLNKKQS